MGWSPWKQPTIKVIGKKVFDTRANQAQDRDGAGAEWRQL
jgi:hypothetical protein